MMTIQWLVVTTAVALTAAAAADFTTLRSYIREG